MKFLMKNPLSRKTGINNYYTNGIAGGPENFKKIKANKLSVLSKNVFNSNDSTNQVSTLKILSKPYSANYILTQ